MTSFSSNIEMYVYICTCAKPFPVWCLLVERANHRALSLGILKHTRDTQGCRSLPSTSRFFLYRMKTKIYILALSLSIHYLFAFAVWLFLLLTVAGYPNTSINAALFPFPISSFFSCVCYCVACVHLVICTVHRYCSQDPLAFTFTDPHYNSRKCFPVGFFHEEFKHLKNPFQSEPSNVIRKRISRIGRL